jgi:hypothetical protein
MIILVYKGVNLIVLEINKFIEIQGGSNMTGTDLCVNKPHCTVAVRP